MPRFGIRFYVFVGLGLAVLAGAVLGLFRVLVVAVVVLLAALMFPLGERIWVWRITRAVRAERRRLRARQGADGDR